MNAVIFRPEQVQVFDPNTLSRGELCFHSLELGFIEDYPMRAQGIPAIKIAVGNGEVKHVRDVFNTLHSEVQVKDHLSTLSVIKATEIVGIESDPLDQPNLMELLKTLDTARYTTFLHVNGKKDIRYYTSLRNCSLVVHFSDLATDQENSNYYQLLTSLRAIDTAIFEVPTKEAYQSVLRTLVNLRMAGQIVIQVSNQELFEELQTSLYKETIFVKLFPTDPLRVHLVLDNNILQNGREESIQESSSSSPITVQERTVEEGHGSEGV